MNTKKERKPIVWVVKEQMKPSASGVAPMDYTSAYEFGELRFITEFDPPLHPGTVREEWKNQIVRFVAEYDPEKDFIILTGSPLAIFLIGGVISEIRTPYKPRILVWRREQSRYVLFN